MKSFRLRQTCLPVALIVLSLGAGGCTDDFYLSEKEVQAYASVLETESSANLTFDNLRGRSLNIQFDNSSQTPRVQSINLQDEMRRTELAQLETGSGAISLGRLDVELQKQIGNWINGRLALYTSASNDSARLKQLDNVSVSFLTNPTFSYRAEQQAIDFDVRVRITANAMVEVNALNWLIDLFKNINGSYLIAIEINELHLQGSAHILSQYANTSRIQFQLTPELVPFIVPLVNIPVPLTVTDLTPALTVPDEVKLGAANLLIHNLSSPVDETFDQEYDYFSLPHISLSSAVGQRPSRLQVVYRAKQPTGPAESTDPILHVVTRGTDGKLYHGRKSEGGWSEYNAIPFPSPSPTPYSSITGDPALFHSGGGQLELAATDENGDLIYAHWRDEAWGNFQIVRPNVTLTPTVRYRWKPAIVASAPGQAEIIVPGTDGNLWHLRRLNGAWRSPAVVPLSGYAFIGAPYRDPTAVFVGNKIVVLVRDGQLRLAAIAFDLDTGLWGQAVQLRTKTGTTALSPDNPAAVASGEERVDVVYTDTTGVPQHRVMEVSSQNIVVARANSGITFRGRETSLGGALTSAPVLVASRYRHLELLGRFGDGQLRHNHFVYVGHPITVDGIVVNPGWQGWYQTWLGMNGNLPSSATKTDEHISGFSVAATPTGRVEVAARANVASEKIQRIFHNSFEGRRYAAARWKTVHWRGYEVSGMPAPAGTPALVAIDRNFHIGYVGHGSGTLRFYSTVLSASNASDFAFGSWRARAPLLPVHPVILSSGPETVDYIYLGNDLLLHHTRSHHFENSSLSDYKRLLPAGLTVSGQLAAASYGGGFIELAATLSDGCLYHWRFRDGQWSNARGVACHIASAPALIYTGAGQIELLAVDSDHKLYRWRYTGTSWAPRLAIPSSFFVSEKHFGPASVSSWGDGTVDLVVVNRDTHGLYHRRVGPDTEVCTQPIGCPPARVFFSLGGSIHDKPVLTAFSPVNLNVLTMTGLEWYSNWSSAERFQPAGFPRPRDLLLHWSGYQRIGGSEMVVGGAANAGPRNYAAMAVHFDGRIFVNRYQEPRWTGFQPVVGQPRETLLPSPVVLPAIASHGK